MNIILLSGGSGKRLWPLSNSVRSKQFIKLFKRSDGEYESMLQRIYRQLLEIDPRAEITVAASKNQISAIRNQLGDSVAVSAEPCRRDTFPAIVLAAAYLTEIRNIDPEEPVLICPADSFVEDAYFAALKQLLCLAEGDDAKLTLLGVKPTEASEKFGYIIPRTTGDVSPVESFREKPDRETAASYLEQGALWNCGVFACRLKYLLEKGREQIGFRSYRNLLENYETVRPVSFDYAVAEKEPQIQVLRFDGIWKDLGTWDSFTETIQESVIGKGTLADNCTSVHIVNETDMPVLAVGLRDVVISASPEGILVSDKRESTRIKAYAEQIERQVMYAEKSWGSYKVLNTEAESLTIKVTLNRGHRMNYHSHKYRDEVWVITSGRGRIVVDERKQEVGPGDVVTIGAGCRHTILAETELKLVEVQLGRRISVSDKQKYHLEM